MTTSPSSLPVLIVGAGPTGLTLALTLTRYGVPVRILERKDRLSRHTKATNLMQRTQELLFALNLLDPLNEIGGHMSRLMVHAYGKCFGPRTMHLKETPFADVILCGQHNFEAVAARELAAAGVSIEFGATLTGLSQTQEFCLASLETPRGTEQAQVLYAVGCDGYAGITRKFTCLDFETQKTGVAIRQVDCRLQWRRLSTMRQMWLFYFNQGFAVVVPLPGGIHRILTVQPKASMPEREPTLPEMETQLRRAANDESILLSAPEWFSYTDLSMGIAPAFRDGRVFLAGDAGNPVLPNGGQGMNTGIADAVNLGWKLAAVVRHGAADALLDTYQEERYAFRSALQKAQFNSLRYTTLVTPKAMQAAFRLLAEPLLNAGGEYKMAQAFSELTIHTRRSSLTLETAGHSGVRAGDRAPDASVVLGTRSLQLYELLYAGHWTLLAFSGTSNAPEPFHEWQRQLPPGLACFLVSTSAGAGSASTLFDLDEEAHRAYRVKRPTLFLVRPDGHIGARVLPRDLGRLRSYLERWLPDPSQSFAPAPLHVLHAARV